ncbi:hypothetical protein [Nocardia transvalensis]|uniref:hypothetical protein n=1 Tax=Nocardia transvalensis TaxID=37333 RepID=UPI0018949770|nr:hypothetical protein [Nocardia transvalensis]MBF6332448.1 hypothetical protein [Nocardia transvalensis]
MGQYMDHQIRTLPEPARNLIRYFRTYHTGTVITVHSCWRLHRTDQTPTEAP